MSARVTFRYSCDEWVIELREVEETRVWGTATLRLTECFLPSRGHRPGKWCSIGGIPLRHSTPRVLIAIAKDWLDSGRAVFVEPAETVNPMV
jgi:hypothetical protein